jgi:hypothetical protein
MDSARDSLLQQTPTANAVAGVVCFPSQTPHRPAQESQSPQPSTRDLCAGLFFFPTLNSSFSGLAFIIGFLLLVSIILYFLPDIIAFFQRVFKRRGK